jgi:CubicO group peptidase (beta-lactamase class C family)
LETSHSGGWAGFRTFIVRYPERRLSVVVLSNSAEFNPVQKGMKIARVFLGESRKRKRPARHRRKIRLPKSWFWSSANRNELCLLLTRLK